MPPLLLPFQLVLLMFAGWINRHQLDVIANILKENGIGPAPERDAHTRWSTFLKAHWECLTATDFLSVEVFTFKGLITHYILLDEEQWTMPSAWRLKGKSRCRS